MRAVAIAFALGCGASPPPAPPPPSNTPPTTALSDIVVDHLRAYRDDMCTCADGGCAREVDREMRRWHDHHKDLEGRPQSAEADQLDQAIHGCEAKARGSNSGDDSTTAVLQRFATEMCGCGDGSDASVCAKRVMDELSKWGAANADKAQSAPRPTEDEAKLVQQLTECATKAMMAGVQQPANP